MNRKRLIIFSGVALVIVIAWFALVSENEVSTQITAKVEKRDLDILVYTSGHLEAEKSVKISCPKEMSNRSLRIYDLKITDLIEEGTYVDSGDYVGALDHAAVEEQLKKAKEEYKQMLEGFEDAKMDSNLTLSNIRDQITTLTEDVEEKEIILAESKYESPSTIRKAEMEKEKAKRKLNQEIKGYQLKKKQELAKVKRKALDVDDRKKRVGDLEKLLAALNIKAPKPGMLIYAKTPWGRVTKVGSTVNMWNSTIAELPDLSRLISKTYVNEVDIAKIKVGQKVEVGIDAYPEKKMTGEVITLANVGQPMPRSDAKVFEVKIRVHGSSKELKPAMTTSNVIIAGSMKEQLTIPSDAIFSNDTLQYVYVDRGSIEKQIIAIGDENENFAIVKEGVKEGETLLLIEPENDEEISLSGVEIYQKIEQQKEEEKKKKEEELAKKKAAKKPAGMPMPGGKGKVVVINK
ncbi:HlyD family efflux transporter periplasmic adaptor subunit [Prolixibacteraceae bacterium JC049]|nr:HlyD family efflux transporter periplasmic adaptor subunit [Prolixibacteraceae bacterium JC049]